MASGSSSITTGSLHALGRTAQPLRGSGAPGSSRGVQAAYHPTPGLCAYDGAQPGTQQTLSKWPLPFAQKSPAGTKA